MLCIVPVMGVVSCAMGAAAAILTCAVRSTKTNSTPARNLILDMFSPFGLKPAKPFYPN
jgi:hypothetical protein